MAVLGDLATARHVAIVVPGMGTTSADQRSELGVAARHLYDAASALDPDVAVVAWLGYDAPGRFDVLLDDDAQAGGRELAAFVAKLPRAAGSDVTVVAHSYGTVVAAAALRAGMRVDAVALLGSPGMQAAGASDLPLRGAALYAERAPLDAVALSEAFGRDPTDPRFGAIRLATGPGVRGHGAYFDTGSVALANLGAVVAQRPELLVTAPPTDAEKAVGAVDDVWRGVADAPLDAAQAAIFEASSRLDDLEGWLPAGPWDGLVGSERRARSTVVESTSRALDSLQRAASPDAVGDLAGDVWDLVKG